MRELHTEHAFHVFLEGALPRRIGSTIGEDGSPHALAVPPRGWFVRPYDSELTTTHLAGLIDAVAALAIPGLSLAGFRRLDDDATAIIARAAELEYLDLFNTSLGDAALSSLASLGKLSRLSLAGTRVTDAGMATLARLPVLDTLDIGWTDVGDAGLESLRALSSLRSLSLRATRVSDHGLSALSSLPLRELDLQETAITDVAVSTLRPLAPTLERLLLGYTRLTDSCVDDLRAFGRLHTLMLRATRVSPDRDKLLGSALAKPSATDGGGVIR